MLMKNSSDTIRLVVQRLDQLRHRIPQRTAVNCKDYMEHINALFTPNEERYFIRRLGA
jgi:hypothetical protein